MIGVSTLSVVDRTTPQEQGYYQEMMNRLDSLDGSLQAVNYQKFEIGFSKVSITPDSVMALAGYGARKPKEFDAVLDSIFIRTLVISTPSKKVAILSADLLIIHPLMTQHLNMQLGETGWNIKDVFLTATHTHSSIGQWAPGLVGGLFAGDYDEKVAEIIAKKMVFSLQRAEEKRLQGSIGFSSSKNPDLVLNRLVGTKGIEDPFQKNIVFKTSLGDALFTSFSAHATCLTKESRNLSGDFPSAFHDHFIQDSSKLFTMYAAGSVASMGPETPALNEFERKNFLGKEIANRVTDPSKFSDSISIHSFRIPLSLGKPQFKISKDLILRPYLFDLAFGDEPSEISGLLLGNVLFIGTPCDFSGELAIPLYQYAKERGLELIITSFNGGYIGYITKDEWYDLEKYETRTMNWYGPGNGAYFSEIIRKLIDIYS